MLNITLKCLALCALCALSLSACKQQKQASSEVGAKPKEIIDQVTNDLETAQKLADDEMQGDKQSNNN
jgi:hypothetical protein